MMNVSLFYIKTPSRDAPRVDALLSLALKHVGDLTKALGGSEKVIEGLVIADESYFAKEVAAVNSAIADGHYDSIGHTVRLSCDRPVTRVFLRIEALEWILEAGDPLPSAGKGRLGLFIVAHEIGHAVDNETRRLGAMVPAAQDKNWLRGWRTMQSASLIQEIAAQKFASVVSTPEFLEEQRSSFQEDADLAHQVVLQAKNAHRNGEITRNRLTNLASPAGWRVIEQFAKIRTLQQYLPTAEAKSSIGFRPLGAIADQTFRELEAIVDRVAANYPNDVAGLPLELEKIWKSFMALYGLNFSEQEEFFSLTIS